MSRRTICFTLCLAVGATVLQAAVPAFAVHGATGLVSLVNGTSTQGNGASDAPSIDPGAGRYVAFTSAASNLVASDGNGDTDVFVRDLLSTTVARISLDTGGASANAASDSPSISSNGRYVAFRSDATDLVAADGNGASDVFLRDRDTDADGTFDEVGSVVTTRVSVDSTGADANGDSRAPALRLVGSTPVVAFESDASDLIAADTNGKTDIFMRTGSATVRVSESTNGDEGDGHSTDPTMSATGRYVAFTTAATNLLLDDANDSVTDVVLRDRDTDADSIFDEASNVSTTAVSTDSFGGQGSAASDSPSISGDGQLVAFRSDSSTLVDADTNTWGDVFLRDVAGATTTRVSVTSAEGQSNGRSDQPVIANGGSWIAFRSWATNLVASDSNGVRDVFVRDLPDGTTERTSVGGAVGDTQANNKSYDPAISADGQTVVFSSDATNLLASDTNSKRDVLSRTRDETPPGLASGFAHPGHVVSTWSSDQTVSISWTAATDTGGSGLDGYSYSWSTSADTVPDTTKDLEQDGGNAAISPALADGSHWFHIRAVDNEGLWGATAHRGPFNIDSNGPVAAIGSLAGVQTASFTVPWSANDGAGSGVKDYEVRYRYANYTSGLPSTYTTWKATGTTATSATFSLSTTAMDNGRSYCFTVRARDQLNNVGGWSTERCTAAPRDERTFTKGGTWTDGSSSSYYRSTYRKATATNAYLLSGTDSTSKYVTVLATKCSSCGTIKVIIDYSYTYPCGINLSSTCANVSSYQTSHSLYSSTTKYKQPLISGAFPTHSVSMIYGVKITVTSTGSKPVYIDGVAYNKK